MSPSPPGRRQLWRQAITSAAVWRRALIVGSIAGFLQVCLHQGNVIFREGVSWELVAKSALSPAIGIAVALAAAAWVYVEREQTKSSTIQEPC